MHFQTNDLGVASYLFSVGINIVQVITPDRRSDRYFFEFNLEEDEGYRTEELWWSNSLSVNPRTYFEAIKQMKTLILRTKDRLDKDRTRFT